MGLAPIPVISGIFDRIAGQGKLLRFAINSGNNTGTKMYFRVHQGAGTNGDYQVENDLIDAAYGVDTNTVSGTLYKNMYTTLVQQIDSHVVTTNGAVSLDSYLNISGINVHPEAEEIVYQARGTHLDAVNVFFEEPNILVATYAVTGSGTGTYSSSNVIGTGSGKVSSTNHAAAKFILVPIQDLNGSIQINLRLLRENRDGGTIADSYNVFISSGTPSALSGTQYRVNCQSGQYMYLDCNNIVAAGGGGSDGFRVYALREREVYL